MSHFQHQQHSYQQPSSSSSSSTTQPNDTAATQEVFLDDGMMDSPDRSFLRKQRQMEGSPKSVNVDLSLVNQKLLPDLEDVERELQLIVQRSAQSKASYKNKLVKLAPELKESNALVNVLSEELKVALEKRDKHQAALDKLKAKREQESDVLQMRKLNMDILRLIMSNPNSKRRFVRGLPYDISFEVDPKAVTDMKHRRRLEAIYKNLLYSQRLATSADRNVALRAEGLSEEATDQFLKMKQRN
eukprot:CAMPEP_0119546430 /NCGR_PEP_ID=MMETSP1352-20130426/861_1 /TAXON_ID=265584 /ORGANISM="Stauroneis constricta, Strain CCMP1120" /LENGTH=243 /DNA_ID=CAMNT_0007591137 /DNA_START=42 /DNA_END=773 /DNA_ORIENTATION=+